MYIKLTHNLFLNKCSASKCVRIVKRGKEGYMKIFVFKINVKLCFNYNVQSSKDKQDMVIEPNLRLYFIVCYYSCIISQQTI